MIPGKDRDPERIWGTVAAIWSSAAKTGFQDTTTRNLKDYSMALPKPDQDLESFRQLPGIGEMI
jgi:hypothetical protein